jgi:hypothetical protein
MGTSYPWQFDESEKATKTLNSNLELGNRIVKYTSDAGTKLDLFELSFFERGKKGIPIP